MASVGRAEEEEEEGNNPGSASGLFERGFQTHLSLRDCKDPTSSEQYQEKLHSCIRQLEDATREVSLLDVFSSNESVDEVATGDLKFFLLPSLLGSSTLSLTAGERKELLDAAETYFQDFLSRCRVYRITESEWKAKEDPGNDVIKATKSREEKVRRFREEKRLEEGLKALKAWTDEETRRKYYLTLIQRHVLSALEELDSIHSERPLLEHMARLKGGQEEPKKEKKKVAPFKPVIITRNEAQKKVFGAGYPSLAVMSIEDFYDNRVKEGIFPDKQQNQVSLQDKANDVEAAEAARDSEEAKAEEVAERDDPAELQKARSKDDWKDTHKRGYGNRYNRS